MQEITLTLTIEEVNLIMDSLGNQPFNKVFGIINKIQQQASTQLGENGQTSEAGSKKE